MIRILKMVLLCFALSGNTFAENWPGWRGPRGDGTSSEQQIPVKWNGETGEGVAWKMEIPGVGHSSPIVWDDKVFLTTCTSKKLGTTGPLHQS